MYDALSSDGNKAIYGFSLRADLPPIARRFLFCARSSTKSRWPYNPGASAAGALHRVSKEGGTGPHWRRGDKELYNGSSWIPDVGAGQRRRRSVASLQIPGTGRALVGRLRRQQELLIAEAASSTGTSAAASPGIWNPATHSKWRVPVSGLPCARFAGQLLSRRNMVFWVFSFWRVPALLRHR